MRKKFWLSKTFWMNLLIPVLMFAVPSAGEWVGQHPVEVSAGWGVLNIILRAVTKSEVGFLD